MRDRMTFEEFVDWIKYSSSTCIHPAPHVNQLDWLVDPSGNVLVDFIGKFEQLERDWKTVARQLHLPQNLPHANRNADAVRHYSEYYTLATRNTIAEKFRTDIQFFGYEFGD
jgi:hypothetical protein